MSAPHPVASLIDYVEASARRLPDKTAIVDPAGWSISYTELDDQADRFAGFLVASGVRPGDRVGVILPKGVIPLIAFLGILKARAAYVPADYTAPAERNRAILSDCQVRIALLTSAGAAILESWPEGIALPAAVVFVSTVG
jgi:acyl-CoA synthetase (AMP-forming)/AMP-acid ligase II